MRRLPFTALRHLAAPSPKRSAARYNQPTSSTTGSALARPPRPRWRATTACIALLPVWPLTWLRFLNARGLALELVKDDFTETERPYPGDSAGASATLPGMQVSTVEVATSDGL